jgi:hypothetical protein
VGARDGSDVVHAPGLPARPKQRELHHRTRRSRANLAQRHGYHGQGKPRRVRASWAPRPRRARAPPQPLPLRHLRRKRPSGVIVGCLRVSVVAAGARVGVPGAWQGVTEV